MSETELAWTLAMEEAKKQDCIEVCYRLFNGNLLHVIADNTYNPVANEDDVLMSAIKCRTAIFPTITP